MATATPEDGTPSLRSRPENLGVTPHHATARLVPLQSPRGTTPRSIGSQPPGRAKGPLSHLRGAGFQTCRGRGDGRFGNLPHAPLNAPLPGRTVGREDPGTDIADGSRRSGDADLD